VKLKNDIGGKNSEVSPDRNSQKQENPFSSLQLEKNGLAYCDSRGHLVFFNLRLNLA